MDRLFGAYCEKCDRGWVCRDQRRLEAQVEAHGKVMTNAGSFLHVIHDIEIPFDSRIMVGKVA